MSQSHNQAVNRTPKAYRVWFPPLRSGAGYLGVKPSEGSDMIRSLWWRIVPPFECTVVKEETKRFLSENSELGRRIIESELFGHIRRQPDSIVRSVRINHEPVSKVALSLIATIAKMKLSSGNHHTYRGVLSMTGADIERTWNAALDRMVAEGYMEPTFKADMDAELKACISSVG